jgi:glyoxylase-like metal-dependent hydrolase (beta-lactamase superfamily II)
VKRGEYDYATHPNERTSASYFERNFMPIVATGKFEFVVREREIVKGIRVIPTPGHTPFHQSVLIESAGERAFFLGDLCPTSAHLPLPWIMGYDVEPLVTLETKRRIFRQAQDEEWLVVFEHDATVPWGKISTMGRAIISSRSSLDKALQIVYCSAVTIRKVIRPGGPIHPLASRRKGLCCRSSAEWGRSVIRFRVSAGF